MAATLCIEAFQGVLAERIRRRPEARLALFWLGQAGFILDTPRLRLVIDLYLSDSLAEKHHGTRFPIGA